MIATFADNIQSQITRRNELEQIRDNRKDIADTYQKLKEAGARLRQTVASFSLIKARLTNEQVIEATTRLQTIRDKLKASHEKFAAQYRQVKELDAMGKLIEDLDNFLVQAWASYVLMQTQPHFELLNLVMTLPEVAGQSNTITITQNRLRSASNSLPRKESHLTQFDADLQALQNSLVNLRGLNSSVTNFLHKVQKGTASVADLTDDLLDWCRENERATAFKISFGQARL
jgi:hypothetical protein